MHIVIPMSGLGQRFVDAGYSDPKPLIKIDGKPIIEHIVNLFPGETKFSFICNSDHLKNTQMRTVLKRICPQGKIFEISKHKLGPVFAVRQIFDHISDEEEVIVNYCDFGTYWDYKDFLNHTRNRKADGAVVSYRGFHPHMLGTTNYAFMRSENQWMLEIQEKKPFTDNRMNEFASNGTYYFRTGEILKKYFTRLMELNQDLGGEYYVSMVYNLLVKDYLKVSIYKVQHMLQWGTPRDVEEYNLWSNSFRKIIDFHPENLRSLPKTTSLVPMAGKGARFQNEGYSDPKPLIEVSGRPMVIQALAMTPKCERQIFVCLQDHLNEFSLDEILLKKYSKAQILPLTQVTSGQASTCYLGIEQVPDGDSILISACDNGMIWDHTRLLELIEDKKTDGIIFSFKGHPQAISRPEMYGWIENDFENLKVKNVSVKKPLSGGPSKDHSVVVGAFWIRKKEDFFAAYKEMIEGDIKVNGEFYMDTLLGVMAKQGKFVVEYPIDSYICWGTPNEYKTFCYWQSYFSKDQNHPYTIQGDPFIPEERKQALEANFRYFKQESV